MTTLIVNETTKEGKAFLEYARKLPFVKTIQEKTPNKTTLKAMKEAEQGKVITAKSTKELLEMLKM